MDFSKLHVYLLQAVTPEIVSSLEIIFLEINWIICILDLVFESKILYITPSREVRAARSSVLTEQQMFMSLSVVLIASHTRAAMPGPKLGLTEVIHSPWLILNSYLCFT